MAELVLRIKGRVVKTIAITKPETLVGRDPSCDVFIDNSGISRWHAKIMMTGEGFKIGDAGSANGTYVNGYQIKGAQDLNNGDEIQVGKFSLTYLAHQGPSFVSTPEQRAEAPVASVRNPENTIHLNHAEISHLLEQPMPGRLPNGNVPRSPSANVPSVSYSQPPAESKGTVRLLAVLLIVALLAIVAMAMMLVVNR